VRTNIEIRRKGVIVSAVASVLLVVLCPECCAQSKHLAETATVLASPSDKPTDIQNDQVHIQVSLDLVVVPVTVLDAHDHAVDGLDKKHFALYDDKVEQQITHFTSEDAPVSIGLVFDTSDSMRPKLQSALDAVGSVLSNAKSQDELFLVQFSNRAKLLVSATNQTEEIRKQLAMMQIGGTTALLDAVRVALNEMSKSHHNRKAIIIISDGEDNASQCSVRDVKDAVRESDVVIYAMGITNSGGYSQDFPGSPLLKEITESTGGRLFEIKKLRQLPEIASKINTWMRKQYVLAYTPSNTEKNGRYHHIQVRITRPDGFPRLHAFWRLGYYLPRGE